VRGRDVYTRRLHATFISDDSWLIINWRFLVRCVLRQIACASAALNQQAMIGAGEHDYIPIRNDLGVTPASLRKKVVKWLWPENPARNAMSAIGRSVSTNSFFARSMRCCTM
jgi:hypothetical protein